MSDPGRIVAVVSILMAMVLVWPRLQHLLRPVSTRLATIWLAIIAGLALLLWFAGA